MATSIYNFATVDASTDDAALDSIVNSAVQSIEDNLPHRYADTFAALDAMNGSLYPDGEIAILTADSTGVKAGSSFTRAGGKWLFSGGYFSNVATFVAALTSNVGTMPGTSFYDIAGSATKTFTNTTGTNTALVLASSSAWTNIAHLSGYYSQSTPAPFSYMVVQGGVRLRGTVVRTDRKPIQPGRIASLPSPARPSHFSQQNLSGAGKAIGTIWFETNGDVVVHIIQGSTTDWFYFDNVFLPKD